MIWGLGLFEVTGYGAKGDKMWGIGDRIWGAIFIYSKRLILKLNNTFFGMLGDRIWGER